MAGGRGGRRGDEVGDESRMVLWTAFPLFSPSLSLSLSLSFPPSLTRRGKGGGGRREERGRGREG